MSLVNNNFFHLYDIKPDFIDSFFSKLEEKFSKNRKEIRTKCPACACQEYTYAFQKNCFHYIECNNCATLYVQNCLTENSLSEYENSVKPFLKENEYKNYINSISEDILFNFELMLNRLFLVKKEESIYIAYEGRKLEAFMGLNAQYSNVLVEKLHENGKYDLIILHNAIENRLELKSYIEKISKCLKKEGFLYITARVGSGIDILTLRENSNIYPIEHMNLLSIEGMKELLQNEFIVKEMNTPGILDVELILKSQKEDIPFFIEYMKHNRDENALKDFQIFIQKNLLSSYLVLTAQRKK